MGTLNMDNETRMRQDGFLILDQDAMLLEFGAPDEEACAHIGISLQASEGKWPEGYYVWQLDNPEGPFDSEDEARAYAVVEEDADASLEAS